MKTLVLSLIGLLVIGVTVVALLWHRLPFSGATASTESASDVDAKIAQLEREIARLRTSQEVLTRATWSRLTSGPAAPVGGAKITTSPPAGPEGDPPPTETHAADQASIDPIAAVFEREATDASWAGEARATLLEKYGANAFAGAQVAAECKSTFCRMTFSFESRQQADGALTSIALSAPWHTPTSGVLEAATGRIVFYIARPGQQLVVPTLAVAPN
jgi:hypothetical protein